MPQLPIATPTAIAIYITIWWIVLFVVLPFGVRSQHEEPDRHLGTDPGAPVAPRLLIKAIATTIVSVFVWVALMAYIAWAG